MNEIEQAIAEHEKAFHNSSVNKSSSKVRYMDFVLLSDKEHTELVTRFGEQLTKEKIAALNDYIGSKGTRYKSHYHTILNWARRDNAKPQGNAPESFHERDKRLAKEATAHSAEIARASLEAKGEL